MKAKFDTDTKIFCQISIVTDWQCRNPTTEKAVILRAMRYNWRVIDARWRIQLASTKEAAASSRSAHYKCIDDEIQMGSELWSWFISIKTNILAPAFIISSIHPISSISPLICRSVCPSVRPCMWYRSHVRPSVRPSVSTSVRLSVRPSARPSVLPSIRQSFLPWLASVRSSVRPFFRPSVLPSVRHYIRSSVSSRL